MPKVLLCASNISHIKNFHLPYLEFFKRQGFDVHVAVPELAALENADVMHQVPITKRLISFGNFAAVNMLRRILLRENYDLIIVHTTLAAFVTRLGVLLAAKQRPKLINTVHGYFFWDGCGFMKRLLYGIPERLLRSVTDCVITMNDEDYTAARKLVKKDGLVLKVHGMGVNASRFQPVSDEEKRQARLEKNLPENAFVLVYAAEFSKRKNHLALIRAMVEIKKSAPEVLLLLCGSGAFEREIHDEICRLGLGENVRLMGWCSRMEDIYQACDLAVSTSRSEGLPFNIVEAQLCALPVVASRIRGHRDLIRDGESGWCYEAGDVRALAEAVLKILKSHDKGKALGLAARQSALQYTLDVALRENTEAYMKVLNDK